MRFINLSLTALAMATSVMAQTADFDPIYTPKENEMIPAGSIYTITWKAPEKYQHEIVSISLIGGDTQNTQVPLQEIDSNVVNSANSYAWKVDKDLGKDNVYGLVFKLKSNPQVFQYSMPFKIIRDPASNQEHVKPSSAPVSASNVQTTKLAALTSSALPATSTIKTNVAPIAVYPMNNCSSTLAVKPMATADVATSAVQRQTGAAATTSLTRLPTSTSVMSSDATSVARAGLTGIIGCIMFAVAML
ncbi:hypothetical protein CDD82_1219 [Ophiocordyceps australis]|uniref:Yeast cell wall synthesis Kre9/Knh1-like N-terminal domain-containing protein n=1 Tax=Ophiocordyceps australis TaxID=1399860 RepID=A0A2C5ZN52_9HYPO|nr:hypothetical protein CDD82_1219 [Ophiocordyceps australis]